MVELFSTLKRLHRVREACERFFMLWAMQRIAARPRGIDRIVAALETVPVSAPMNSCGDRFAPLHRDRSANNEGDRWIND